MERNKGAFRTRNSRLLQVWNELKLKDGKKMAGRPYLYEPRSDSKAGDLHATHWRLLRIIPWNLPASTASLLWRERSILLMGQLRTRRHVGLHVEGVERGPTRWGPGGGHGHLGAAAICGRGPSPCSGYRG
jgi:hypothetical protein